jgi:hypothetical protein
MCKMDIKGAFTIIFLMPKIPTIPSSLIVPYPIQNVILSVIQYCTRTGVPVFPQERGYISPRLGNLLEAVSLLAVVTLLL